MVLQSLREAFRLLRSLPALWLTGIATGLLGASDILLTVWGEPFFSERVWILQIILLPFFVSGSYGVIRADDGRLSTYIREGFAHYFNVLLPGVLIFLAVLLTIFVVLIPLTLVGIPGDIGLLTLISAGVIVPMLFFTFFYDTAAVFQEKKVFESLLESIRFVVGNPGKTIVFFIITLALFAFIGLLGTLILAAVLAGHLEPLTMMSQAELDALAPADLLNMLGTSGIWTAVGVYFGIITLFTAIIYPFKAVFYRNYGLVIPEEPEGEYDEKGRWFKY